MSRRVLVDTTVWIDFFRGKETRQVSQLESLIQKRADLCICGLILTEVLQGIGSDAEYHTVRSYLTQLLWLPLEDGQYEAAAQIYRTLRKEGITIRKSIDCLIAAIAIDARVAILHNDRDFDDIAAHFPLQVYSEIND
jgi:predicted nucleic acid-binding protein